MAKKITILDAPGELMPMRTYVLNEMGPFDMSTAHEIYVSDRNDETRLYVFKSRIKPCDIYIDYVDIGKNMLGE